MARAIGPLCGAVTAFALGCALAAGCGAAAAHDAPLAALPYTPGLDPGAMDPSADPCVDFYQYACGGWVKNNPVPADQRAWSVYGKLYADNQRFLWGILAELAARTGDRNAGQQKIGDLFAACSDEAAVERLGAAPLMPALARIDALRSRRELPALLAAMHLDSGDQGFLFGFAANQDFADSSQVIAFADAGGLGLPDRDYYTDRDGRARRLRAQYLEHVTRTFALLGESRTAASAHAAAVLRIETALARGALTRVERRDPHRLFHKVDRAGLQRLTPAFDWNAYLAALGRADLQSFNVAEPAFYAAFNRLLLATPLADLKAYLRWHAAHSASPYLSTPFVNEQFAFFSHTLRGVPELEPRWKRCVRLVDTQLGEALGEEFVARAFSPELKAATLKMVRQIEQAMREDIEQLGWMSPVTKHHALAKLDSIVNKVGYPDRWRDYGPVEVRRDDLFGDVARATQCEQRRQLAKIGKPLDRSEWGMTPPTVNAYYNPQMNDINFPAGVLQPPLYDPRMDAAPNYGNTGGTIGHELTHGFDDEGRQFDAAGNLKDWWTTDDARQFTSRTQCIVDQYAQYVVVDDVHVNSRLTLGEDIADLGGLILAQLAWRAETAGQTLESRDGLTPEQRFFVGYAQWACESNRPENQRVNAKTDPHSPGRYRVNGLVVNMPEFERAFACHAGQPMVRADRCRVW
jgi:putative endopeptidase